jgi:hypothetical protein
MVNIVGMSIYRVASEVLSKMESLLGADAFHAVIREMEEKYLDDDVTAKDCFVQEPRIFEKALVDILGSAAETILAMLCSEVQRELKLSHQASYKKSGDLEICLATIGKQQK